MNDDKTQWNPACPSDPGEKVLLDPANVKDFVQHAAKRLLLQCPQAEAWMCAVSFDQLPARRAGAPRLGGSIPFLSIRAFRSLEIRQIAAKDVVVRYQSSGSTSGGTSSRGQHLMGKDGLLAYAQAAGRGYLGFLQRLHATAETTTLVSMIPRQWEWQHSSLAAMFELLASSGINVVWSSPKSILKVLANLQEDDAKASDSSFASDGQQRHARNVIVFGTSVHHHIAHALSSEKRLSPNGQTSTDTFNVLCIVDTGGAKGRTVVLEESERDRLLRSTYSFLPCKALLTASQYGMCELASQAWSSKNILNEFIAAPSLIPVVVDPETLQPAAAGTVGLMAFIDFANVDSYPAILTEDLGVLIQEGTAGQTGIPGGTFRLLGRAPMASIKGCSLRVQDLGFTTLPVFNRQEANTLQSEQKEARSPLPLGQDVATSAWEDFPDIFTKREKRLLLRALQSCPNLESFPITASSSSVISQKATKKLIIIASANVAITFLFPILAALENAFSQVDLVLPSLRDDDPLAPVISRQIAWILEGLQSTTAQRGMAIASHTQLPDGKRLEKYHTMIVFGSNETVNIFKETYGNSSLRILGFGDISNTIPLRAPTHNEAELVRATKQAELCLSWRGRGCLTPRVIVTDESPQTETELHAFCQAYHKIFSEEFSEVAPELVALFHWHSTLEVRAQFGRDVPMQRRTGSSIVDLRQVDFSRLAAGLNLSLAGQGFVFVIRESQFAMLAQSGLHDLQRLPVAPAFDEPHQGRSWTEWLSG